MQAMWRATMGIVAGLILTGTWAGLSVERVSASDTVERVSASDTVERVSANAINDFFDPVKSLDVDVGFLLEPGLLTEYAAAPGSEDLSEIVRVGARALDWVDVLQRDVPAEEREQIWRRIDRVGREPTPEKPMQYNPANILERYRKAMADAPAVVADTLRATGALPRTPPPGLSVKDVVGAIREVHATYSRASRWLVLYEWRFQLRKSSRDLRGWLRLRVSRDGLKGMTERWEKLSEAERAGFVEELAQACPITTGDSVDACRREYADLARRPNAGAQAARWLDDLLARGQRIYDSKFGVQRAHEGVRLTSGAGSRREIAVPTYGVEPDTLQWIQKRVEEAWNFGGVIGVSLFSTPNYVRGAVKVRWEKGALPNVNGIGGDVITMDSNTPKWLEHTQTVMRHEMGHVLGFPDCYTEFWEPDLESFTYYSLDPSDAMCALSGEYLERHRDALVRGYFSGRDGHALAGGRTGTSAFHWQAE